MASDLTGKIYNDGAASYDIFYRVKGSTGPWIPGGNVVAAPSPALLTLFTIQDVPPNEYEFYFISRCANGEVSGQSTTFYSTPVCAAPLSFNAVLQGSNFVITYTVPSSVGLVELLIEYPNGGTFDQNYGVTSPGQITVPVPAGQWGDYTFTMRSVCNVASGWYSPWFNPVLITTQNPGACPPPEIVQTAIINTTPTTITYRFTMAQYTPSVRVVVTNNTTGSQQNYNQPVTSNYFDVPLTRGNVVYNYSVGVYNLCTTGVDNTGDVINLAVPAINNTLVSTAGWTVSAGPDIIDVDGNGVIGTMVTVNTNGLTPSATNSALVIVRFNCSTSGYAYVNVTIAPGATTGTTRDWNSECTIDLQSPFISSVLLL
jgi:hypothetical protein